MRIKLNLCATFMAVFEDVERLQTSVHAMMFHAMKQCLL